MADVTLYISRTLLPHKVQFFPSPRSEYCPVLSRASYGDVMLHTETDDSDPTFVTDLEMTDLLTALSALIILITINLQTLSRLFRSNSILTIRPGLSQSKSKVSQNYKERFSSWIFRISFFTALSLLRRFLPSSGVDILYSWWWSPPVIGMRSECHLHLSSDVTITQHSPPPHTSNTITTTEYISPSWFSSSPISCVLCSGLVSRMACCLFLIIWIRKRDDLKTTHRNYQTGLYTTYSPGFPLDPNIVKTFLGGEFWI